MKDSSLNFDYFYKRCWIKKGRKCEMGCWILSSFHYFNLNSWLDLQRSTIIIALFLTWQVHYASRESSCWFFAILFVCLSVNMIICKLTSQNNKLFLSFCCCVITIVVKSSNWRKKVASLTKKIAQKNPEFYETLSNFAFLPHQVWILSPLFT